MWVHDDRHNLLLMTAWLIWFLTSLQAIVLCQAATNA